MLTFEQKMIKTSVPTTPQLRMPPDSSTAVGRSNNSRPLSRRSNRLAHGADTGYLRSVIEKHEEAKTKRFTQPGEARNLFKKIARRAMMYLTWVQAFLKVKDNWMEQQLAQYTSEKKRLETGMSEKVKSNAGYSFDKHDYEPNKDIALKPDVRDILNLPPSARSENDIKKVLAGLQTVKSFVEYPQHVQEKLCRVAWYQPIPAKKVIIRQGHKGLYFYFVITGRGLIKMVRRRADGVILSTDKVVFQVNRGASFGDIALLHDVERTATVESVTEMSLLVIGRDDFKRIFMQREVNGVTTDHALFLSSINVFKHWPIEKFTEAKQDNLIFHYFKRGKLIVADSCASDYLYVIKAGSCEVIKQLKSVEPQTAIKTKLRQKNAQERNNALAPSTGCRVTSTIPRAGKLPKIRDALEDDDAFALTDAALTKVCRARETDPNVNIDLPKIILDDLNHMQKTVETPTMFKLVEQVLDQKNKKLKFSIPRIQTEMIDDEETTSKQDWTAPTYKEEHITQLSTPTTKRDSLSLSNTADDESYRKVQRKVKLNQQKSLLPASVTSGLALGEPSVGFSKGKLLTLTQKWNCKSKESANHFKELDSARELSNSAQVRDQLIKSSCAKRVSYSTIPDIEETDALLLSHEGKSQSIQTGNKESSAANKVPAVFVRLALLRPKDVFGLDTLKFDANYVTTQTSVTLVSRGAEVLMINKKFFLKYCTSENLEHLRNIIAPYPSEGTMQVNLQISSDWSLYCEEQLADVLRRRRTKAHL